MCKPNKTAAAYFVAACRLDAKRLVVRTVFTFFYNVYSAGSFNARANRTGGQMIKSHKQTHTQLKNGKNIETVETLFLRAI